MSAAEDAQSPPEAHARFRWVDRIDGAWVAVLAIAAGIAVFAGDRAGEHLGFAGSALLNTLPFIAFAVLTIAVLKATGAESLVAKAFQGRELRMIVVAALAGGLSPFCSCEVIPFIAGLLALGAPLPAVMAFWLSSPLMDPPGFIITAGALGFDFAIAKTLTAVGVGLMGGLAMKALASTVGFDAPLKPRRGGGCGCAPSPFKGAPVWSFWREPKRRATFAAESRTNALFLLKWLTLAYLLEALMIAYVPAEAIGALVGGGGLGPVLLSALLGAPAYLNGYAAPPLVAGMIAQGMSDASAMAFLIAGGVSSIPAMTAVFALVKRPVFIAYLSLGYLGAVASGLAFGLYVALA